MFEFGKYWNVFYDILMFEIGWFLPKSEQVWNNVTIQKSFISSNNPLLGKLLILTLVPGLRNEESFNFLTTNEHNDYLMSTYA